MDTYSNNWSIEDWHQGRLSSRKLLVITDGFPHDSWLMTALRMEVSEAKQAEEKRIYRMVQGINMAELEGRV